MAGSDRPGEPLMAILLDNEPWAARKTVGDRDGLPQDVLRNLLGWESVVRIWLPSWLEDPEAVLDSIDAELVQAGKARAAREAAPAGAPAARRPGSFRAGFREQAPRPRTHPGKSAVFKPWDVRVTGKAGELDELKGAAGKKKAASLLAEIVDAEWPILDRRLAKLAINSYEFGRVSAAREKTMLAALNKKAYVTDADGFIWPAKQDQSGWTDHRTAFASHDVKAQEISPREIANLMCALVVSERESGVDELKRAALGVLGYGRMTEKITRCLQQGLELAVRDGRWNPWPARSARSG